FSSRRRHTRFSRDWSSDVCSSDLATPKAPAFCPATAERPHRLLTPSPNRLSPRRANPKVALRWYRGNGGARSPGTSFFLEPDPRSEERRVGKECRSRGLWCGEKKR